MLTKLQFFFKSISNIALQPAMVVVMRPAINKINSKFVLLIKGKNRIIRYTPAVTSVEEWTKAETGVGAAMAAGNQAEKGIWALLVKEAIIINTPIR